MMNLALRRDVARGAAVVAAFALTTIVALLAARTFEQNFMPVLVDWRASETRTEGDAVVVSGMQRKVRDCVYVGPIRAETAAGAHLLVTSRAPASGQNWVASAAPRAFGPWVIHGAAGHVVTLYAEHRCHPMWPVFSTLGTIGGQG